jgi:hypothetical protein
VDIDAGGGVLGVPALEQVGDAAGELHDLLAAGDLAQRIAVDLAVLGGDEVGQLALARVEELAEGEHDPGTSGEGGLGPGVCGLLGRGDHGLGIFGAGEGYPPGDLAGGGVGHVSPLVGGALEGCAVDPVWDLLAHLVFSLRRSSTWAT